MMKKLYYVTLSLFAYYSKAFDSVDHKALLHNFHSLQFSHSSLHMMDSYLTERKQFVQIDDKRSPLARVYQWCTSRQYFKTLLFNFYVHDLSKSLTGECLQFADDTTLYCQCKAEDITENAELL